MLRQPESRYEIGRSSTLLKVKQFQDAEARVVEHLPGAGRHRGRMGALLVELPNGKRFSVGTGFTDAQRNNPPTLGSTITFRYQELTDGGIPHLGGEQAATPERQTGRAAVPARSRVPARRLGELSSLAAAYRKALRIRCTCLLMLLRVHPFAIIALRTIFNFRGVNSAAGSGPKSFRSSRKLDFIGCSSPGER
jgi:hypothetical protein